MHGPIRSGSVPGLQFLARGGQLPSREATALVERLSTFSSLFSLYLSTLHDAEFYGETLVGSHLPFPRSQLVEMVATLRDVYVSLHMEKHILHSLSRSPARLAEMKPSPVEYQQLKQVQQEMFMTAFVVKDKEEANYIVLYGCVYNNVSMSCS